MKLASVTGRSLAGKSLGEVFPHLGFTGLKITEELDTVDLVFSALDHKVSAEKCLPYIHSGIPLIDMSADFRLKSVEEYQLWYEVRHPEPALLQDAVYGLTELHRDEIPSATLVANPGCYPTGAVLALAPAVKAGLITGDIIVDSKSGVSGAGRGLRLGSLFSEVNESVAAYSLDGHRHYPEIGQELQRMDPKADLRITFVPHLIPMTRGILSSCYAPLAEGQSGAPSAAKGDIFETYRDFYRDDPFVKVTAFPPATKYTLGNNDCLIYPTVDPRTRRLVVISVIDNLVKGASGAAVQNMNLMLGYAETAGLEAPALYP
ncbi:MAG: N-acetyl-gamma-glutamyl-phosphate reductase [Dehalococcoidia bacterium]|nr:N-acetyl-gamma-glutamyl-phosphate reductase [Dehalococcoidia bacterium]